VFDIIDARCDHEVKIYASLKLIDHKIVMFILINLPSTRQARSHMAYLNGIYLFIYLFAYLFFN